MTCSKCGYEYEFDFQICPSRAYNVLEGKFRDPQKASSKPLAEQPKAITHGSRTIALAGGNSHSQTI